MKKTIVALLVFAFILAVVAVPSFACLCTFTPGTVHHPSAFAYKATIVLNTIDSGAHVSWVSITTNKGETSYVSAQGEKDLGVYKESGNWAFCNYGMSYDYIMSYGTNTN